MEWLTQESTLTSPGKVNKLQFMLSAFTCVTSITAENVANNPFYTFTSYSSIQTST